MCKCGKLLGLRKLWEKCWKCLFIFNIFSIAGVSSFPHLHMAIIPLAFHKSYAFPRSGRGQVSCNLCPCLYKAEISIGQRIVFALKNRLQLIYESRFFLYLAFFPLKDLPLRFSFIAIGISRSHIASAIVGSSNRECHLLGGY